jgi:hypothetical protein
MVNDAGDGGVDSGVHEAEPDREPYTGIDRGPPHAHPICQGSDSQADAPEDKEVDVELVGVEERDDEHCEGVISDSQSGNEEFERK